MSDKQYAERDIRDLEPHYIKHVSAMTGEGLHSKADIAAELAYRDKEIESLRQQVATLESKLAEAELHKTSTEHLRVIIDSWNELGEEDGFYQKIYNANIYLEKYIDAALKDKP